MCKIYHCDLKTEIIFYLIKKDGGEKSDWRQLFVLPKKKQSLSRSSQPE